MVGRQLCSILTRSSLGRKNKKLIAMITRFQAIGKKEGMPIENRDITVDESGKGYSRKVWFYQYQTCVLVIMGTSGGALEGWRDFCCLWDC